MREGNCAYRIFWADLRERDNLEDTGLDGRIILKLIFNKRDVKDGKAWTGLICHRLRTGGGLL
jgi:hypothetical protein